MPRMLRSGGLFMVVLAQVVVMTDSPAAQQLRGLSARVEAQMATSLCGFSVEPPSALPPSTIGPHQTACGFHMTPAERVILEDFQRLWRNHVLADLSVEVRDYRFSNGVVGKLVAYHITERN